MSDYRESSQVKDYLHFLLKGDYQRALLLMKAMQFKDSEIQKFEFTTSREKFDNLLNMFCIEGYKDNYIELKLKNNKSILLFLEDTE